ncbi:MAG: penicillin-binding protein 2 [Pseudomonadales bacterium]|nr:penicillin-binding protein 2 [Pseudomonadales bacterium]
MAAWRLYVVVGCFLAALFVMGGRVVYLHVFERDFLQDQGDARTIRMERINAHRGMIQDRQGKPMAISSPVVSLWANPAEFIEANEGMDQVALMLEIDPAEFRARMEKNRNREFVYLRRKLVPEAAEKVLALDISGVYAEREYERFYPAGEVAAHVVGFTDVRDEGQEGLELSYNQWLKGQPGRKKVLKNLYGEIVRDIMPVAEASPGKNLELSIDLRLQYLAYRELKSAVSGYEAQSGSAVILDVDTGQVLALVNHPSFNPNNRAELDINAVRNRAVTDVFEPGSTVKPFTVAVALGTGRYSPQSTIDTNPGYVRVDGKTIPDPANYGVLDLGGIIEKSSQVGITRLALDLNEYEVWQLFSAVGLGQSTGMGFPGERTGYLPNHRRWKDIERATFAYGYGLTVTPLQLASAYLTIASGGMKRQVTLLKSSGIHEERVMDERITQQLISMMKRVTEFGTGSKAALEAYSVAGKTGTVRKRKEGETGYDDTRHMAFFAGMTPAEHPRLVGVIMIDDPRKQGYGGGSILASVFSRIMSGALRMLNVTPQLPDEAA